MNFDFTDYGCRHCEEACRDSKGKRLVVPMKSQMRRGVQSPSVWNNQ